MYGYLGLDVPPLEAVLACITGAAKVIKQVKESGGNPGWNEVLFMFVRNDRAYHPAYDTP